MTELVDLLGIKILPVNIEQALKEVIRYVPSKNGDFFCFANIHLVMECHKDPKLGNMINQSAANFPDGMGLVMGLRMLECKFEFKVRGTDLMLRLCSCASKNNLKIFFYGNSEENLAELKKRLTALFPNINIAGAISPPFRRLTDDEDSAVVKRINDTDPDILFVSLGAPKQEKWMADHKGKIKAVQLGVGAAFDFIAGNIKQAPLWMQKAPLEWLYRLPQQPRKTVSRMLLVPSFFYLTFLQLIRDGRLHFKP